MERIQISATESLVIPDDIITADRGQFTTRPHSDPALAKAGVTVSRAERPLVEQYVAASADERKAMLAAAAAANAADSAAVLAEHEARTKARNTATDPSPAPPLTAPISPASDATADHQEG